MSPSRSSGRLRTAARGLGLVWRAAPLPAATTVGTAIVSALVPVAAAWFLRTLLDLLAAPGPRPFTDLLVPVAGIALCGLAGTALAAAEALCTIRLTRHVRAHATDELFGAVDAVPWLDRMERPEFQDTLKLAEQSAERASDLLRNAVGLVRATLQGVGWLASVFVLWPPMALLLVLVTVPFVWVGHRQARQQATFEEGLVSFGRRRHFFRSLLVDPRAAKEIRLFRLGAFVRQRVQEILRAEAVAEIGQARRMARADLALAAVSAGSVAVATLAVVTNARSGDLSVGDFSLFLAAAAGAQTAIAEAGSSYTLVAGAVILLRHYFGFVDRDTPPVAPPRSPEAPASPPVPFAGRIELRDVWFRYSADGPWALSGVNLVIPAGAKVGLVGRNGAGKSTLVKLLCRLYEPTGGQILFDGVDARDLPAAAVRRRITAVFQDFMTYDLTVADNIAIGDIERRGDRRALRAAAELADLDTEIEALPGGYDTMLSKTFMPDDSGGHVTLLSGGQWQRLAIARALLRTDAAVAILDEPNSGLDAVAQRRLREVVHSVGLRKTMILISHHLGSLRDLDTLFVLDRGRLVEHGTHDELVAAGGVYGTLFALQADPYLPGRPR